MLAFSKIAKQKQLKKLSDQSPRQSQSNSIVLECPHYSYRNRNSLLDESFLKGQVEHQSLSLNQSQDFIQTKKNHNRIHHFEEMKMQNLGKVQPTSQKLDLEEEKVEVSIKKDQKQIAWKDILDLSINIKGSETSRIQTRITTPQYRVTRFHGFQLQSKSQEKQNFNKVNLSINNIHQRAAQKESLTPIDDGEGNNLMHSQYHNSSQNKDNLIYVRRIQTPNKFHKPFLLSPIKSNNNYEATSPTHNQEQKSQKTSFILQNRDIEKASNFPSLIVDRKQREHRQKEIQEKMRSYFIKNQLKSKQEIDKFNNCSVRGLSMTPIQKQHNPINYYF